MVTKVRIAGSRRSSSDTALAAAEARLLNSASPATAWMRIGGDAATIRRHAGAAAEVNKPFFLQMVGTGLTTALMLHFGATLTHAIWPAVTCMNIYTDDLITEPIVVKQGYAHVPEKPGLGVELNGARIWVSLGPLNFQPGEFAKLALAIFFAAYLAERRELIAASTWKVGFLRLPDPQYLLPIVVAWGFAVLVMVGQRDLGSSLLFFTLFVVMMWVATERATYLVLGLVMFAGAAYVSWKMFGHVQTRVSIWRDPWADEYGKGYQIVQALYGLGDGGIVGTGLGRGSPDKVPEAQNDFIFAALGEELGLLGATGVLIAYLLIIGAGLRIAIRTDRTFEKLLATGLTTIIGVQAFIIIGGVIKVVPLTGITLPFVSYGGSNMITNMLGIGLVMNVVMRSRSREVKNRIVTSREIRL